MTFGLLVGLLLLAGLALVLIVRMEGRELQQTMEKEGREEELHYRTSIRRLARLELAAGGDLESLGDKLTEVAFVSPAIQALWLVDPPGVVVASCQDLNVDEEGVPCFPKMAPHPAVMDVEGAWDMEHPPGEIGPDPMGCIKIPLEDDAGAVLIHAIRPWSAEGEVAKGLIRRTTFRLAPVFLTFYLLMSALLLMSSRAVRLWRERAEAVARTQALGTLAVGLGHEIRNPLNTVALSFDYLGRRADDDEARRAVALAREQAERIGSTLEEFVRYTAAEGLQMGPASIARVIGHAAAREERCPTLRIDGDVRAEVDSERMQTAFLEIFRFFMEESPPQEPLDVQLRSGRRRWQVRVRGATPNLSRETASRIFDLYVRSRPHDIERGLALARAVFQAHGGALKAQFEHGVLTIQGGAPTATVGEGVG